MKWLTMCRSGSYTKHVTFIHVVMFVVCVPFLTMFYFSSSIVNQRDTTSTMQTQVDEIRERLKHASMINHQRSKDIDDLRRTVQTVFRLNGDDILPTKNGSVYVSRGTLWQKHFNVHQETDNGDSEVQNDMQLPSLKHYLPHLKHFDSLKPVFKLATARTGATLVLGVPTIKRPVESYLISTLESLIVNMSDQEKEDSLIIVCIAENDMEYIQSEVENIKSRFQENLDSGLLEVIVPPQNYYPDLTALRNTLGDSAERVRWRTKQNLDYAYLMMYAQAKGTFYVQLEDDILTKAHYISTMKSFAYKQLRENKEWIILDFCQLGFIGKMFKAVDLSKMITFLAMFHNDKPVDWLLDHLIQTKVCRFDRDSKHCKKQKDSVWIHYKPSLFQHVGTHSSLKGKLQKLKDKHFGKFSNQRTHINPPSTIRSTLKAFMDHTMQRAYQGEDYFWCKKASKNDIIEFYFSPPLLIERFYFRTGNEAHPNALLLNASVQIMLFGPPKFPELVPYPSTVDGHFIVGNFQESPGMAEGGIVPTVGPVSSIRIKVEDDHDFIVLSEIAIETASSESPIASAFNMTYSNATLTSV